MIVASLFAAQLLAATPAPTPVDPRPTVRVVFRMRPNHPYVLPFRKNLAGFEKTATEKLIVALRKVRFLRFSADEGQHTLFLLLDDRDEGIKDDVLREIWLFGALNEEVTRDNAKITWTVRGAGQDNMSIGSAEKFAGEIAKAVRDGNVGELIEKCFRDIDVATRARKPAQTSFWLMPFHIDQLQVGDRSVFEVWAPTRKYAAEPHDPGKPVHDAEGEYAGTTVTLTRGTEDVVRWLEQRGRIDATKVRMTLYVAPTPPPTGQPPAGVKPKKKS